VTGSEIPPSASRGETGRQPAGRRMLRTIVGGFSGATVGWVAAGAVTTGDLLEATDPRRLAAVVLAAAAGAYLSWRARGRGARVALYVVAALCFLFWVAVPAGWWATSPPPPAAQPDRPAATSP
jgi:hypothetical protein